MPVIAYNTHMSFSSIPEIIEDLKAGKMIVLVDDEDRENEGDIVIAGDYCTPAAINFMIKYGRGVPFIPTTGERLEQLKIPMMTKQNTARHGTAMAEMVDSLRGTTTGVSAPDRAATVAVFCDDHARPEHLARPGHMIPLRAEKGGVLVRAGHTEAIVDLCISAGLKPVGVGCEVIDDDGQMMRRPQLELFSQEHGLKMCTIADLISYRLKREQFVKRMESVALPTNWGTFTLHAYQSVVDAQPHLALCKGGIGDLDENGKVIPHPEPVLVRVHSECLTGDVFGSGRCDCGPQLSTAMELIEKEGKGVLVYLRQEGRGIGLTNKLHAYALQDQGLDTVEANVKLGLPVDKRDYGIGSQILRDLGLTNIRILTNNPKKIYGLEGYGLHVTEELPLRIAASEHNQRYLETKKLKLGHTL
ncbi:MAG TPA: GTP cyclohydrolase II [Tepidisphaeraceae bacterium]|nr:GTP cyclohydrolase II [Tepidisphaeraceae bacterium]